MNKVTLLLGRGRDLAIWALVFSALYLVSTYSYLLFHTLAEIFAIVVAFAMFAVVWNAQQVLDNGYLLFAGPAYAFIAAIDVLHTLSYKGMGVFPEYDANLATQLWIAGRYLQSLTLLIAPAFVRRRPHLGLVLAAYGGVTGLLLLSIFAWHNFPIAFVEDRGLTPFKIVSEYIISGVFVAAMALLWRSRKSFDPAVMRLLLGSMLAATASELAFTTYVSVYGSSNLLGHLLRIISVWLLYKGVVETALRQPYRILYRDLQQSEERYRAQAEEAGRRAAEFDATFTSIADGVIMYAPDGSILRMNPGAERILGYTAEERAVPLSQRLDWLRIRTAAGALFPHEDLPLTRALHGETVTGVVMALANKRTGETVWVSGSGAPVRTEAGKFLGAVVTLADITHDKQAEAEQARLLAAEQAARAEAEQAVRAREQFLSLASHELKTPLTVLLGHTQAILRRARREGGFKERDAHALQIIADQAAKLNRLILAMLDVSRLDMGQLTLQPQPMDLRKLTAQVVSHMEPVLAKHTVEYHDQGEPVIVLGDALRLEQVLQNLLQNAVNYSPENCCITIAVAQHDGKATVRVTDRGIGVPPEALPRLFERFYRAPNSEAQHFGGIGMGLYVVKQIVELHGGTVTVESQEEVGSTFTVQIPVLTQLAVPVSPGASAGQAQFG